MTDINQEQLDKWISERSRICDDVFDVTTEVISVDDIRTLFAGRRLVQAGESMTNARLHGCEFDGWQCFHCSEVFTTVGGAADHFGATPDAMPGCLIRVQLGNERGLQMEIRRLEAELAKLKNHSIDDYGAAVNEIETGFQALLSALSLPAEEGDGLDMAAASCISHVLKSIADGLKPLGIKRDDDDGSYRTSPTEALQPASPDKDSVAVNRADLRKVIYLAGFTLPNLASSDGDREAYARVLAAIVASKKKGTLHHNGEFIQELPE